MKNYKLKPMLLAMMLLGISPSIFAEAENTETLPEVAVKARKEAITLRGSSQGDELLSNLVQTGILGDKSTLEVPFSIQSYTRDLIQAQQSRTLADVLKNDASTRNIQSGGGYAPQINIRGFDTISTLWDGMLGGFSYYYQDFPLELVDAVEVMKGPSAILFGGGNLLSPAGTVNFVPKRAPLTGGAPIKRVTAGMQTGGAVNFSADLGDRFGAANQFGYRVNVAHRKGDLAIDPVSIDEQSLLISMDYIAMENLKITVDVGKIDSRKEGYTDIYGIVAGLTIPKTPDNNDATSQPWGFWNADREFALIKADWQLAKDWNLNLAATKSRHDFNYISSAYTQIDDSLGNATAFSSNAKPFKFNDVSSLQATLIGKFNTGPIVHDLALSSTRDASDESYTSSLSFTPFSTNIYNPVRVPFNGVPSGASAINYADFTIHTNRIIDTLHIGKFDLMLGVGRVSIDDRAANSGAGYKEAATTPLAGLLYKFDPTFTVYMSYAEGFQMGGRAPVTAVNALETMSPIENEQIELGVKKDFGAFQAQAAAFQIKRTLEFVNAANVYVQNGEQTHQGWEASISGMVIDDLNVIASAMFIQSDIQNGNPLQNGNDASGVPETSVSLYGAYKLPFYPPLTLTAGMQYKSSQYFDFDNTREIPSYAVFDIGASLDLKAAYNVAGIVRLNVDNVMDKNYWSSASYNCCLAVGDTRTARLSASFDF